MAELYNLIWAPTPKPDPPIRRVSRENDNVVNTQRGVPAIIIYPALTTPAVLVGDQKLELLLLVSDDFKGKLKEEDVNRQLKVSPGLDAMKPYTSQPLFGQLAKGDLEIKKISLNGNPIKTKDDDPAFSGLLDKRALKLFRERKFNQLYRVILKNPCRNHGGGKSLNKREHGRVQPKELHDKLVRVVLEKHNGRGLPEHGKYCYEIGSNDIDFRKHPNLSDPLQSYHPVFQFEKLGFAKLGHLSDIHINARQNVLRQSKARVIEYADIDGKERGQSISPEIGPMINCCSENFKKLLNSMSDRDILLLGGDFIDHIRNAYLQPYAYDQNLSIAQIWSRVALDDNYKNSYQPFVDFIAFYTLILSFCRTHKVPMFAISGNHDAYFEPYGISPRLLGTRANEGIPADHNLTLYEAILIFGETFHELKTKLLATDPSPIVEDKFEWFYTLLTPWADFSVKLPKQHLVSLGWGDDEDILDVKLNPGHLPRSEESISTKQLQLLEDTLNIAKKVVLLTHFTFASYKDNISLKSHVDGLISYDKYSDYDQGTFEKNREALYKEHVYEGNKIQVVLTGHSHRRGLYILSYMKYIDKEFDIDQASDIDQESALFHYYDFSDLSKIKEQENNYEPLIIVSDSAGPLPRRNVHGEFDGWGSDPASGTQIDFDDNGQVTNLKEIKASNKPRIAVAMDYWDIIEKKNVITKFESDGFFIRDEKRNKVRYAFSILLHQHILDFGITLKSLFFYCRFAPNDWLWTPLTYDQSLNRWILPKEDNYLIPHFSRCQERSLFLSINFINHQKTKNKNMLSEQYDFNSAWNFECQIEPETFGGAWPSVPDTGKKYFVKRDKTRASEPDFNWRREMKKYQ